MSATTTSWAVFFALHHSVSFNSPLWLCSPSAGFWEPPPEATGEGAELFWLCLLSEAGTAGA